MNRFKMRLSGSLALVTLLVACGQVKSENKHDATKSTTAQPVQIGVGLVDTATFAAGCFWCVEAQFQQLSGVDTVISGYIGGKKANPTYEEVCSGKTGHAEAVNIFFNPDSITYDELLEAFFIAHDPTQLNRQGNDVGTQYRSAIFFHNSDQQTKAAYYINRLNEEQAYDKAIVTQLAPYKQFYIAEDYHQNYYNLNREQGYCQYVIQPKMAKFTKVFKDKLKK